MSEVLLYPIRYYCLVTRLGLEPRVQTSEDCVLPLHYQALIWQKIKESNPYRFNSSQVFKTCLCPARYLLLFGTLSWIRTNVISLRRADSDPPVRV